MKDLAVLIIIGVPLLIALILLLGNDWYFEKKRREARDAFVRDVNKITVDFIKSSRSRRS